MTLSLQLLWNYWYIYHKTWYVDRTSYDVMHIGRKFWSPHFCGSYVPWNLENICKLTNNLSFLCQFFINEITASDAGPDIIRSYLYMHVIICRFLVMRSTSLWVAAHIQPLVHIIPPFPLYRSKIAQLSVMPMWIHRKCVFVWIAKQRKIYN